MQTREIRRRRLARVQARLARFDSDQDLAVVLSPEATAEVQALLAAVPDPGADTEVAIAAGWLFWLRHLAGRSGDDSPDRSTAFALFTPVYQRVPDALPAEVRAHFDAAARGPSEGPRSSAASHPSPDAGAGDAEDTPGLSSAFDRLRQALASFPPDHPSRAKILDGFSFALNIRIESLGPDGERTGEGSEKSIPVERGDPLRAAMLDSFSGALRAEFDRTGDGADLDAAVDVARAAVTATPAGDPDHTARLSNLGATLQTRFERTGWQTDLDAAIEVGRRAVAATAADHPARVQMLSNLGVALTSRYRRTGAPADIDAAIEVCQQAVVATLADDPGRAARLANLWSALQCRFERTGRPTDLDAVVDIGAQAVAATPASDPDLGMMLSNLGVALIDRFQRTREVADVDAAIDAFSRAVAATPANHPDRAARLASVSMVTRIRSEHR